MPKRKRSTRKQPSTVPVAQQALRRLPPFTFRRVNRYLGNPTTGLRDFVFTTGNANQLVGVATASAVGATIVGLVNQLRIISVGITVTPSAISASNQLNYASVNFEWGALPMIPFSSAVFGGVSAGPPQVHNLAMTGTAGSYYMKVKPHKDSFIKDWFAPGGVVTTNDRLFTIEIDGTNLVTILIDIEFEFTSLVSQDLPANYVNNPTWIASSGIAPNIGSIVCAAYPSGTSTFSLTPLGDMNF